MNYNFLSQLIDNGISEEELIASISRSVPRLANQARKMFFGGWSPKDVLGIFSKDKEAQKVARKGLKPVTPSEMAAYNLRNSYNNIPQSSGQESKQKLSEFTKKAAPLALGAIASPIAGSVIQSALQRALPQTDMLPDNVSNPIPGQPQTPNQPTGPNQLGNSNQYDTSQQPPLSNVNAASIPEPTNINQPQAINTNIIKNVLGNKSKIDNLINSGNGADEIDAYLRKFEPATVKAIEKEAKVPLKDALQAYIDETVKADVMNPPGSRPDLEAQNVQTTQMQPQISEELEPPSAQLDETKEVERTKIEKNSVVSSPNEAEEENEVLTPNGFGEVKISRNGKSIVEVDGKKHSVDDSKMLKPPKEAAIEAMELIKSFTPEEMRSTHHMLNSYDEEEKKAFFVFHNGDAYVVDDISPEEYEELSKEVADAKTSGETIIGKWAKGTGSRGAGYNKVVKGHRERKVVPELKKNFRKLKVGYNLLSEWQRLLNEK